VAAVESLGRETLLHIERGDDQLAVLTGRSGLRAGDLVRVCIDPERLHLFPPA
jgi:ABC-type sugar transport system ATPase subunit